MNDDILQDPLGGSSTKEELLRHLKEDSRVLNDERLEAAFRDIDRADFVAGDYLPEAYEDYALPISSEATISQPTTVAFMLELLNIEEGERVLDVGAGSGWSTALIAHLAGGMGSVLGVEIDEELIEFGRRNLSKYTFKHARIEHAHRTDLEEESFDKILFSAEVAEVPEKYIRALGDDGLLLVPVAEALHLYRKRGDELVEEKVFPGFVFVPYKHGNE